MTHTTHSITARPTRSLSRPLIAACAALAIMPALAQAEHRQNRALLLPIVDRLHANLVTFEQLASRRWFPNHEFEYIQIMTKKACRLADAVKCDEHYGRIRGDYDVLKGFVRTVDQRLCRHRAAQYDQQLMQLWTSIKHEFDAAACLVRNKCSAECGHLTAPVALPPFEIHGTQRHNSRPSALPPAGIPLPRDFNTFDGRRYSTKPYEGRANNAFRDPVREFQPGHIPVSDRRVDARYGAAIQGQRQTNPGSLWLDLLSAALSR